MRNKSIRNTITILIADIVIVFFAFLFRPGEYLPFLSDGFSTPSKILIAAGLCLLNLLFFTAKESEDSADKKSSNIRRGIFIIMLILFTLGIIGIW